MEIPSNMASIKPYLAHASTAVALVRPVVAYLVRCHAAGMGAEIHKGAPTAEGEKALSTLVSLLEADQKRLAARIPKVADKASYVARYAQEVLGASHFEYMEGRACKKTARALRFAYALYEVSESLNNGAPLTEACAEEKARCKEVGTNILKQMKNARPSHVPPPPTCLPDVPGALPLESARTDGAPAPTPPPKPSRMKKKEQTTFHPTYTPSTYNRGGASDDDIDKALKLCKRACEALGTAGEVGVEDAVALLEAALAVLHAAQGSADPPHVPSTPQHSSFPDVHFLARGHVATEEAAGAPPVPVSFSADPCNGSSVAGVGIGPGSPLDEHGDRDGERRRNGGLHDRPSSPVSPGRGGSGEEEGSNGGCEASG